MNSIIQIHIAQATKFPNFPDKVATNMSAAKGQKSDSGASKRKRRKAEQQLVSSLSGSILRHLVQPTQSSDDSDLRNITTEVRCSSLYYY